MNALRRIVLALLLTAGCATFTATAAAAYNTTNWWNTSATPLEKSGYGSTAKAYGHIKIFNGSNGTRMYSYSWNKFTDGDNHRAYTTGKTQYNAGTCRNYSLTIGYKGVEVAASSSCKNQFYDKDSFRNNGLNYTQNSSWTKMATQSFAVHDKADRGRLAVYLAIDVPWKRDPISGVSYSTDDSW